MTRYGREKEGRDLARRPERYTKEKEFDETQNEKKQQVPRASIST